MVDKTSGIWLQVQLSLQKILPPSHHVESAQLRKRKNSSLLVTNIKIREKQVYANSMFEHQEDCLHK